MPLSCCTTKVFLDGCKASRKVSGAFAATGKEGITAELVGSGKVVAAGSAPSLCSNSNSVLLFFSCDSRPFILSYLILSALVGKVS
jgi:hypothetical protein